MPLPNQTEVHVDGLLTNLSVAYAQEARHFAGQNTFARVSVRKQSDKYATFNQADTQRDEMQLRADAAESAGGGYRVSTDNYFCDVFANHIDVGEQTIANADEAFAPLEDATRQLVQRELIKKERQFASDLFTTSVWTGGTSADPTAASLSAAWDDPNSSPIEDIHEQANSILVKTGRLPNKLVLNNLGWIALKNHPDLVDRVKHTSGQPVTEEIVARFLGLDEIVVSRANRNTAAEGLTASYSSILGNHALLVYAPASASLFAPSGAYQFVWTGYPGSSDGRRMSRFYIDELRAWRLEIESCFDYKLVGANLGVLIQSVAS